MRFWHFDQSLWLRVASVSPVASSYNDRALGTRVARYETEMNGRWTVGPRVTGCGIDDLSWH